MSYVKLHAGLVACALAGGACAPLAKAFKSNTLGYAEVYAFQNGQSATNPNDPGLIAQGFDGSLYGTLPSQIPGGGTGPNGNAGSIFGYSLANAAFTPFNVTNAEALWVLRSGLSLGVDGNFYGAAQQGGAGYGSIFRFSNGVRTTLYSFTNGTDAAHPLAPPVQDRNGNLYGPTENGSTHAAIAYRITSLGAFAAIGTLPYSTEAPFIWGPDGNLYGTTPYGGTYNQGTVFRLTPTGTLTIIYSFNPSNAKEGANPAGALLLGADGNYYGTTKSGGLGKGTVYRVTPSGAYTTIHSFALNGVEGTGPLGGLVQGSNGYLYGVTPGGGANSNGTMFKVATTLMFGAYGFAKLHDFAPYGVSDGTVPFATPMMHTSGMIYGLNSDGGSNALTGNLYRYNDGLNPLISVVGGPYGEVNQTIGILGQGFSTASAVNFGSTPAQSFQVVSDTYLTAVVPVGATTNKITVVESNGGLSTLTPFYVNSSGFVPITPCRYYDSRVHRIGQPPYLLANSTAVFTIPGSCGVPPSATAVALNVTAIPQSTLSYLSVWPAGQAQPITSTLNSPDGRIKADAAIVWVGTNGGIDVHVSDNSGVVIDVQGYFTLNSSPGVLSFYPTTPCRAVDTSAGTGALGGPYLAAGQSRSFAISTSACGIPGNAQAYSVNFTVKPHTTLSYLLAWPTGQATTSTSILNDDKGTVTANAAILTAGTNGAITTLASSDTDLAIDVNGYFAPATAGGLSLYSVPQCRVINTGYIYPFMPFQGTKKVTVAGICGVPAAAQAFVLNATVIPSSGSQPAAFSLWPDGQTQPAYLVLSADQGVITSNMALVGNINGLVDANSSQPTQMILDISGYFAP